MRRRDSAILWQAPALAAANILAIDKLPNPLIALALATFNGAMIYAFWRMVVRQSEITSKTNEAEDALKDTYGAFVPRFEKSGVSSRFMLVSVMAVLDVGLLIYALREVGQRWSWAVWLYLICLIAVIAFVMVRRRPAKGSRP